MKPSNFPNSNKVLNPPTGMTNCVPLHVFCDNEVCISKWTPSWKDKLNLLFRGEIWLYVMSGKTQPPVALTTNDPWVKTSNK
jgi:hypothetical protein